jgi:hypothetical protein
MFAHTIIHCSLRRHMSNPQHRTVVTVPLRGSKPTYFAAFAPPAQAARSPYPYSPFRLGGGLLDSAEQGSTVSVHRLEGAGKQCTLLRMRPPRVRVGSDTSTAYAEYGALPSLCLSRHPPIQAITGYLSLVHSCPHRAQHYSIGLAGRVSIVLT